MTARDAFVSEIAADFKHPVETANQHALQIKFERNAQHKIDSKRIVVGIKWFRSSAASDGLQHRRFNLDELAIF